MSGNANFRTLTSSPAFTRVVINSAGNSLHSWRGDDQIFDIRLDSHGIARHALQENVFMRIQAAIAQQIVSLAHPMPYDQFLLRADAISALRPENPFHKTHHN